MSAQKRQGGAQQGESASGSLATSNPLLRTISEAAFQHMIVEMAMGNGWRCHFLPDGIWHMLYQRQKTRGRGGVDLAESGFPDLVLYRDGRLLFIELKSESGRVRPGQRAWLDDLATIDGIEVYVWKPRDEDMARAVLARDAETTT